MAKVDIDLVKLVAMQKLNPSNKEMSAFLQELKERAEAYTVAEACEFGSAKIFKEQKIWIKSKEPVLIVPTNNKIPKE